MGIPNAGPWGTLSNMITKKIGDAREKKNKMKEQETQTSYKAWEGLLTNPNSSPEERDRAGDELKKLVPKDTVPIVEGYHKMINALHSHKQVKEAAGGGGGAGGGQAAQPQQSPGTGTPPAPGTSGGGGGGGVAPSPSPTPAPAPSPAPTPAAPVAPAALAVPPSMSLGKVMSDVSSPERTGNMAGRQAKAQAEASVGAPDPVLEREKAVADYQHAISSPGRLMKDLRDAGFTDTEAKDIVKEKETGKPIMGKEPKPVFGPGGQFRALEDPINNATYLSRASIPANRPDLQRMWDEAKGEEAASDKKQEDKESRQLARQIAVQTSALENALKRSDYITAQKEIKKAKGNFEDAIDRMRTMDDNLRDIAEAKKQGKENQQAMLSLLANHIGMTSGAQPKMRMSKAQWDEAKDSVPYLQRVEAHFDSDGYLSGVVLTPEQMEQMVALAHDKAGILQEHVNRVEKEYADDLGAKTPKSVQLPKGGKGAGKSKGTGTGAGKKIVVTPEDMQGVQ